MRNVICWMLAVVAPLNCWAEEPSSSLPQGFSQEPDCTPESICIAEGVSIPDERYYEAIAIALAEKRARDPKGTADLKVIHFNTNPNFPNVVQVRFGTPYSLGGFESYALEFESGQWVITSIFVSI